MTTIFVYGTLRWGEGNHGLLAGAKPLGAGRTVERMTLLNLGGCPAVIAEAGPGPIVGELYEVDGATLQRLDRLEGYPRVYDREQFVIETESGRHVVAWMYFFHPSGQRFAEVIPSGDWKARTPLRTTTN